MKILVVSDTHGNLSRFYEVFKKEKNIDMVIHLGDFEEDAMQISKRIQIPVNYVKGNCDGAIRKQDCSQVLDTEYGKIFLTHGHLDGVSYDITNLIYRSQELGCCVALFGHTHMAYNEEADGIKLVNPGSLVRPRDGSDGTYGILEITKDSFVATIKNYEKPKAKAEGGFIRGIINYSDRF
ncbi:MAG: metallophosphoesterase [Anaerovoracaceae bacterium]